MRTTYSRTILAGVALMAITTTAAAQDRTALLTSIEVRQLVASGQRDDDARLRDHFAALAEMYSAEAARHTTMARTLQANLNHALVVSPDAHQMRLAKLAATSAVTVRELSVYYNLLASGITSPAPNDSARFEAGEGAPAPNDRQIRELVASARTAADHRSLEEYFAELGSTYTNEARQHDRMALSYRLRANIGTNAALALYCEWQAKRSRQLAGDAVAAATEQRQLARTG
jgi:hypothetical protein